MNESKIVCLTLASFIETVAALHAAGLRFSAETDGTNYLITLKN